MNSVHLVRKRRLIQPIESLPNLCAETIKCCRHLVIRVSSDFTGVLFVIVVAVEVNWEILVA